MKESAEVSDCSMNVSDCSIRKFWLRLYVHCGQMYDATLFYCFRKSQRQKF